jgi:hypothetical protein
MNNDQHLHQLLREIAEAEVPAGSLDLTGSIRPPARLLPAAPRPAPRVVRQRFYRPAFVALCLLALLAFGLRLLPGQAPSVSAQEALQRAEQASSAFGISGIRSLHGVLETFAPGSGTVVREETWLELPSRLRREVIWPAGSDFPAELQVEVTDGVDGWIWGVPAAQPDATPDSIARVSPAMISGSLYVIPNPSSSLDTPQDPGAGLCAQPGDQLALLGEEPVLGRAALVIECRIGGSDTIAGTRLKLWIDKQIFVVLQMEHYDPSGELFVESRYTQLELDLDMPAERFAFTPPAGVPITDER